MMGQPDGQKSFKIGLIVLIQYRLWQTDRHVAVTSAYLRRALKPLRFDPHGRMSSQACSETENMTVQLLSSVWKWLERCYVIYGVVPLRQMMTYRWHCTSVRQWWRQPLQPLTCSSHRNGPTAKSESSEVNKLSCRSLTNCSLRLCNMQWRGSSPKHTLPLCYLGEYGRSKSNGVGISNRSPETFGAWYGWRS